MAVNTTENVKSYACDGSLTDFDFPFKITGTDTSILIVTIWEDATSTHTILSEESGAYSYSVAAPNNNYDNGGTISTTKLDGASYVAYAWPEDYTITIERIVPYTQPSEFVAGGLDPKALEQTFDNLEFQIQQLDKRKSIHGPPSDSASVIYEIPGVEARKGKYLGFESTYGNVMAVSSLPASGVSITAYAETLLDDANAATAQATLKLKDYTASLGLLDLKAKGPVRDVRAYGAKLNGTDDDAAAINSAIGTGNCVVHIPYTAAGCKISSPIAMKSNTILRGDGRSTFIYPDAETFAAITVTGTIKYWSIKDLSISYGEATGDVAATNAAAVGIQLLLDGADYPYLFDISRVNIYYPYRGFEAADVASFMYSLENVFVYKSGNYGYWIDPTVSGTTITLKNCYTNHNKGGFRIEKIKNLSLIACASDHTSENYPFYFESCKGRADGLHVEASTINSASINISGGEMQIVAPTFSSNTLTDTAYEIRVLSGAQVEVVGGYNYNTVASGAGTYAVCHASATAKQLIARGCTFGIPTGDGAKTIYLGNVRRYNANTTIEPIVALADEATPSVAAGTNFKTSGTANDPITDFDDGIEGQEIKIFAEHSVVVDVDAGNIFLNGAVDFSMNDGDTLSLICKADNKWYEISRSDNT